MEIKWWVNLFGLLVSNSSCVAFGATVVWSVWSFRIWFLRSNASLYGVKETNISIVCLAEIFTKCFTCGPHIQDAYFTKIAAGFQQRHHGLSVVINHLKSTFIHYVHFLANFTWRVKRWKGQYSEGKQCIIDAKFAID